MRQVFGRALGHPLFTEQLAGQVEDDAAPALLRDVLDDRLGDVDGPSWLGLAPRARGGRPRLDHRSPLGLVCATSAPTSWSTALHDLRRRRLLASSSGRDVWRCATRCSPMRSADAWWPGRGRTCTRALAEALQCLLDPEPGEVAGHWGGAGDLEARELPGASRGARLAAAGRFAAREAAQGLAPRVLDLWPADAVTASTPAIRLGEVYVLRDRPRRGGLRPDRGAAPPRRRGRRSRGWTGPMPSGSRCSAGPVGRRVAALGDPDPRGARYLLGDALAVQERLPGLCAGALRRAEVPGTTSPPSAGPPRRRRTCGRRSLGSPRRSATGHPLAGEP